MPSGAGPGGIRGDVTDDELVFSDAVAEGARAEEVAVDVDVGITVFDDAVVMPFFPALGDHVPTEELAAFSTEANFSGTITDLDAEPITIPSASNVDDGIKARSFRAAPETHGTGTGAQEISRRCNVTNKIRHPVKVESRTIRRRRIRRRRRRRDAVVIPRRINRARLGIVRHDVLHLNAILCGDRCRRFRRRDGCWR